MWRSSVVHVIWWSAAARVGSGTMMGGRSPQPNCLTAGAQICEQAGENNYARGG